MTKRTPYRGSICRRLRAKLAFRTPAEQRKIQAVADRGYHLRLEPPDSEGRTLVIFGSPDKRFHRLAEIHLADLPQQYERDDIEEPLYRVR